MLKWLKSSTGQTVIGTTLASIVVIPMILWGMAKLNIKLPWQS